MSFKLIIDNVYFNIFVLCGSFYILFKCSDYFVESAVGIAHHYNLPKMLVGIIIVGFATTAPEIAVSAQAAYLGHPEIAFGNAIGSVIVDDGVALALAAIISPIAISVNKDILKTAGIFLIGIDIIALLFALNGRISRIEGAVFVALLICYMIFVIYAEKRRKLHLVDIGELTEEKPKINLKKLYLLFAIGLIGVIIAARLVIRSSLIIAHNFNVSETIIGLTIVAIGTSLPEISTCIVASLKGHGEIAVGDIIGADILNILWIIGVSSIVKTIQLDKFTVYFSFISMFIIVGTMLGSLRAKYKLTKWNGIVLLLIYLVYLYFNYRFYYISG
ncbi:MAG: calcium/sodium antiporter [Spirochaetota bacterium]|nr:MAG: calcium/sodium antiporter [Spirochaetota bacterium]